MFKYNNKKTIFKYIIMSSIILVAIISIFYLNNTIPVPKEYVDTINRKPEVKESVAEFEIDDLFVQLYVSEYDDFEVVFYDKNNFISSLSGSNLEETTNENYTWFYDNDNNHRVVWGYCNENVAKNITVNGEKEKEIIKITYTYNKQKVVKDFWYVILDKKCDYTVRNTGRDYVLKDNCRVYLEENE